MPDKDDKIASIGHGVSTSALSPGTIIAQKYKVLSPLGSGGMGTVYQVRQTELGKNFALKVLEVHKQSEVAVRRFQQEAKTAASLRHPNLVEVHDFGVFGDSQPYLVMDYISGQPLDQLLKTVRTLPVDYVVALAIQIGFGLMYAHSRQVVHRDIKPGNIIVLYPNDPPTEGTIKVVDFGIAKLMQSEDGQIQELTRTGEIFGSPIYMSPEQCKGTAVDRRADIYSLGCVIYECLTGLPPFVGDTAMSTMVKRLTEEPPSLKDGSLGLDFPPALEIIVRKMLAVEPEDRYQDFSFVIQDLMRLDDPDAILPRSIGLTGSKKYSPPREVWLVSVTAVICCLTTFLIDKQYFVPPLVEQPAASAGFTVIPDDKDVPDAQFRTKLRRPTRDVLGTGHDAREILHFPSKSGQIKIGAGHETAAQGNFFVPAGDLVYLSLNEEAAADPNFLENLSDVQFAGIHFTSHVSVNNDSVYMFQHLKHVGHLGLSGSEITSLKPIYQAPFLVSLDVTETHIPSEELFKIDRFCDLKAFNFGPVKDPHATLRELAKNKSLDYLKYTGPVSRDHKTNARGLAPDDISDLLNIPKLASLAVLNSPKFDDSCLKRLILSDKFKELEIRDCNITPKAIPMLKIAKLILLKITTIGWSEREKALLKTLPYKVEPQKPEHAEEHTRLTNEVNESADVFLDSFQTDKSKSDLIPEPAK